MFTKFNFYSPKNTFFLMILNVKEVNSFKYLTLKTKFGGVNIKKYYPEVNINPALLAMEEAVNFSLHFQSTPKVNFKNSSLKLRLFPESHPTGIYLLKVNNRNTRTRCEIWSKLTLKTPVRRRKYLNPSLEWIKNKQQKSYFSNSS